MMKEHKLSMASGPLRAVIQCSCGWRHFERRQQNALGRYNKLVGAGNRHLKEVGAEPFMPRPKRA